MVSAPSEVPLIVKAANSGKRFRKLVAIGLANAEIIPAVGGQLVRFVEDHQVIGGYS
ncbi:MAG: hypothetical protein IIC27_02525 [Chloroflexi bacterium]|nr:hypothetical protein [Chloroflexota bacterium]